MVRKVFTCGINHSSLGGGHANKNLIHVTALRNNNIYIKNLIFLKRVTEISTRLSYLAKYIGKRYNVSIRFILLIATTWSGEESIKNPITSIGNEPAKKKKSNYYYINCRHSTSEVINFHSNYCQLVSLTIINKEVDFIKLLSM